MYNSNTHTIISGILIIHIQIERCVDNVKKKSNIHFYFLNYNFICQRFDLFINKHFKELTRWIIHRQYLATVTLK